MLSLTVFSIAILVGLSNSQVCFPADVCWGSVGAQSYWSSGWDYDWDFNWESWGYSSSYTASGGNFDTNYWTNNYQDVNTEASNKYICKDDGSICKAYYNNTDCNGAYYACYDVEESDEMYDTVMCMGCSSYVKIRYYTVTDSSCSDKSEENWSEEIVPTGCVPFEDDTGFSVNYELHSCSATSYSLYGYQEEGCSGQIIGNTRNEGCVGSSKNGYQYMDILHCDSCMNKPGLFIFIVIAIYLMY